MRLCKQNKLKTHLLIYYSNYTWHMYNLKIGKNEFLVRKCKKKTLLHRGACSTGATANCSGSNRRNVFTVTSSFVCSQCFQIIRIE